MIGFSLGFIVALLVFGIIASWPINKKPGKHKCRYKTEDILDLDKPTLCIYCGEPLRDVDGNVM